MSYWIFKTNPDKYLLDERLRDAEPKISWKVTRYKDEIKNGDIAFIWRTGENRGICAVMKIDSDPEDTEELETEQKYNVVRDNEIMMRVEGTLTHRFNCISHQVLRNMRGLENLSVFSGFQQTTNFKVTDEEGKILLKLAKAK